MTPLSSPDILTEAEQRTRKMRALTQPNRRIEAVWRTKFGKEQVAVLKALRRHRGELSQESLRDIMGDVEQAIETYSARVTAVMGAEISRVGDIAARIAAREIGVNHVKRDWPELLDYDPATQVRNVNRTTRDRLARMVRNTLRGSQNYQRLTNDIGAAYKEMRSTKRGTRSRAKLIAVTEMGEAYEQARDVFYDDAETRLELVLEKRWLFIDDGRVSREICKPNGLQGWLPRGRSFQSGHVRPLGHPGCRCDVATRVAE